MTFKFEYRQYLNWNNTVDFEKFPAPKQPLMDKSQCNNIRNLKPQGNITPSCSNSPRESELDEILDREFKTITLSVLEEKQTSAREHKLLNGIRKAMQVMEKEFKRQKNWGTARLKCWKWEAQVK